MSRIFVIPSRSRLTHVFVLESHVCSAVQAVVTTHLAQPSASDVHLATLPEAHMGVVDVHFSAHSIGSWTGSSVLLESSLHPINAIADKTKGTIMSFFIQFNLVGKRRAYAKPPDSFHV